MVVNTNILALNSHRSLKNVGDTQGKASARLSSGLKINSAADDAAGLAISEKMRAQIRGLDMASKNSQDAMSLIQTAEGGMQEINNMLQRIRELIDYASNDTNEHNTLGTGDRQKIQDEINQLTQEIDSMAERVEFNKKRLINGSFADTVAALEKATVLRSTLSLEKKTADTRFETLLAELGTEEKGGAIASLASAQASLDLHITASYSPSLASFTEAQVEYETQLKEYNAAKDQLMSALSAANIANVFALHDGFITAGNGDYKGGSMAAELINAVDRYTKAAIVLGVDELRLSEAFLPANASLTGGATMWGISLENLNSVQQIKSMGDTPASGGIQAFASAQITFQTAQLLYLNAVGIRDTAQAKVNTLNDLITQARRDLTSANARYNAADVSYATARDADRNNAGRPLHFQVGANSNQSLIMSIGSIKTDTLGIGDGVGNSRINVLNETGLNITAQLDVLDQALSYVATERSKLGAAQNRMEYTVKSLDISSENLSASESRIRDADMAKEMMNVTKANVLQQAAISMLAQANQAPQSILQLLR
jgi:flagellin